MKQSNPGPHGAYMSHTHIDTQRHILHSVYPEVCLLKLYVITCCYKYCSDKLPSTYIIVPVRIGPGNGIICIKHQDIGIDF